MQATLLLEWLCATALRNWDLGQQLHGFETKLLVEPRAGVAACFKVNWDAVTVRHQADRVEHGGADALSLSRGVDADHVDVIVRPGRKLGVEWPDDLLDRREAGFPCLSVLTSEGPGRGEANGEPRFEPCQALGHRVYQPVARERRQQERGAHERALAVLDAEDHPAAHGLESVDGRNVLHALVPQLRRVWAGAREEWPCAKLGAERPVEHSLRLGCVGACKGARRELRCIPDVLGASQQLDARVRRAREPVAPAAARLLTHPAAAARDLR
eukprot:CAMPEP_0202097230 /NCGR_PEP_ID=MMETSP0965-20130614/1063_1 /ASSEMBLY_ACC=CAM_ASM_000507 /TAXON_ID=4773 /ORGANISM="Schizochytrium aggregatum, Strain ATCC28209" /LENGTH=270 /DNA_ID=CAMNT_0048665593 /DNA_START=318 /DNA_END=1126 /DNA_ORIENTATION=-